MRPSHNGTTRGLFSIAMMMKLLTAMMTTVAFAMAAGCAAPTAGDEALDETSSDIQEGDQAGPASAFPEAVQIFLDNNVDFCTGVVVNARVVLTAAHCIAGESWTVVAPFAKGAPRRVAHLGERLSTTFGSDPTARDIAVLRLDAPLELAQYPTLDEIGHDADNGTTYTAVAVGRSKEVRTASLVRTASMTIRSGLKDGYTTGLKSEYYSGGGDSGGPLFLVEKKKLTHKLVGLERQPEPTRNADYFTRVDDALKAAIARHD